MTYTYTDKTGKSCTYNMQEMIDNYRNSRKISLIKDYRMITGKGLKDSKDDVEAAYNERDLIELFESVLDPMTISKEEFLNIISDAIDGAVSLFFDDDDMLDTVELLCKNIRNKGGIRYLAKRSNSFINAL